MSGDRLERRLAAILSADAAGRSQDVHRMQAWAGQSAVLARAEPVGDLVFRLWQEAEALLPVGWTAGTPTVPP
jgi:nitronate monooxygenase